MILKQFSDIPQLLAQRDAAFLTRQRVELQSAQSVTPFIDGKSCLSFCSNDYLGLANHPAVAERMKEAIEDYGVGAGASHLVDGHHQEHQLLEQELAEFCGREAALVFSTGYMANMGVMSALMGRSDSIIQDRLNHASLIDGARLAQSKLLRYRHNDMTQVQQCLERAEGKKLLVTDGVFSMDGDCASLTEMADLAQQHGAWVMVDDAHGFGVLGPKGTGLIGELGLDSKQVPLLVGTLGKAFGTSGAFVAGDKVVIDYLLQFSRTYIYTTAAPPAIAAATREALVLVKQADDRRAHLKSLIKQLREGIHDLGYQLMPSETPIQPILVGTNTDALRLSDELNKRGILVTAIRPPTVPEGTSRLRITLSADHSPTHVNTLLNALGDIR